MTSVETLGSRIPVIARVPKGRLNVRHVLRELILSLRLQHQSASTTYSAFTSGEAWPFLGGIARQNQMKALEIGGVSDHVHILLSLPPTLSVAKALQLIKGGSSKWVHDTFPEHRLFGWQAKYGAFAVSVSQLDRTIEYIKNQENHHRKASFQEEFLALLTKHRIAYDPRYIWQ